MKQIASGRLGQLAVKYGDQAPMATVCCNACRTCVTTNIVTIATGAIATAGMTMRRRLRRSESVS